MKPLAIIAGNGTYPSLLAQKARQAGVEKLVVAAFHDETDPALTKHVDEIAWFRVGQLGKMISYFKKQAVTQAIMAGQIAPKNLFSLRPDLRALLMIAKLKKRNAETLFGGIADELSKDGITLLPATTYLEDLLPQSGHIAGPKPNKRQHADVAFGFPIVKETSRLDIGQSIVVKKGTVLAVEAFEGTNEAILRGGKLGQGGAMLIKVSKPNQDFRFDVPVIGPITIETCAQADISTIVVEADKTLLLEKEKIISLCEKHHITLIAQS